MMPKPYVDYIPLYDSYGISKVNNSEGYDFLSSKTTGTSSTHTATKDCME